MFGGLQSSFGPRIWLTAIKSEKYTSGGIGKLDITNTSFLCFHYSTDVEKVRKKGGEEDGNSNRVTGDN